MKKFGNIVPGSLGLLTLSAALAACGDGSAKTETNTPRQKDENTLPQNTNDTNSEEEFFCLHGIKASKDNKCTSCDSGYYGTYCDHSYSGTVTDKEGNIYHTVIINNIKWMAENLRYGGVEHYSVDGNSENDDLYGYLYTWDAAMEACPDDWRLPTKEEFGELLNYADRNSQYQYNFDSEFLALISNSTLWDIHNKQGRDEFGFSALPAGYILPENYSESSTNTKNITFFWTNTEYTSNDAYALKLNEYSTEQVINIHNKNKYAYSVRCIKEYCLNGTADQNKTDGNCATCNEGWAGKYCNIPVTCVNGIPNAGIEGNGKCQAGSCINNNFADDNCFLCNGEHFGPRCENEYYGIVTDQDNNTYKTVKIGEQEWMAENYRRKFGEYYDGTKWMEYEWSTAANPDLCPAGWHLPTKDDFETLLDFVTENRTAASNFLALIDKSTKWDHYSTAVGSDEFGFGIVPTDTLFSAQYYSHEYTYFTWFWTASEDTCYQNNDSAYYLSVSSPQSAYNPTGTPDYSVSVNSCLKKNCNQRTRSPVRCIRNAN